MHVQARTNPDPEILRYPDTRIPGAAFLRTSQLMKTSEHWHAHPCRAPFVSRHNLHAMSRWEMCPLILLTSPRPHHAHSAILSGANEAAPNNIIMRE